jgi:hypothetical protein
MALPSSGPLTLANIQTEFGGSNPISLNEYYAGGANVPAGTSGTYGAVPSSGTISIRNFYGTSKTTFPLPATTNVSVTDTAPVEAGYRLRSDGVVSKIENGSETTIGNWIVPNTTASSYEVRATLVSGSVSTGTTGSYLSLGTTRTWGVAANSSGTNQGCTLTIEVRLTSGPGPVVATATVTLYAEYF